MLTAPSLSPARSSGAPAALHDPALPDVRGHMPPLDGIRGLAVLGVMIYHFSVFSGIDRTSAAITAWHGFASIGWIGVDLFFALSGFLITGILYDAKGTEGFFRTFYARRALRILPLYYGVLAVFFLGLRLLFPESASVRAVTSDQAWYWTHLSNVQVALHGWPPSHFVTHFWSLALEEQFYLVWPVVVLMLGGRQLARLCGGIMVFSLLLRAWLFATGEGIAAFVLMPARMDTLAFGAILAIAMRDPALYAHARRLARPVAGVSAALLAAILLWRGGLHKNDPVTGTIGFTLLGAFFGAMMFFSVAGTPDSRYKRVLSSHGLRFLGKYSYALYVFHQPVAVLLAAFGLPSILMRLGASEFAAQMGYAGFATLASVVLALWSWNAFEKHFLKLKDRVGQRSASAAPPGHVGAVGVAGWPHRSVYSGETSNDGAPHASPTRAAAARPSKDGVVKLERLLMGGATWALVFGSVAGGSVVLGAVAQRSCLPRFCKPEQVKPAARVIESNHARIETEAVVLPVTHMYGALEVLDSSYVVASGEGELFHVTGDRAVRRLPFSVPVNHRAFDRDNPEHPDIQPESFSLKDILVRPAAGSDVEILATHHVWFPERKCFTLRMSSAIADAKLERLRRDWQPVFDTAPCARVKETGVRFAGTGAGGRMVPLSGSEVLLTVGDHEYDGAKGTPAQDTASSFGKTIVVNTSTREARRFTAGHRNPQGLLKSRDGRIWATEHGPKGGDELNVLQAGRNYGWPLSTYGAQYNEYAWPLAPSPAQDSTFVRPLYSWVPSIGVSQLIQVEGRKFTPWSGDLLVASLRASSLFRVRVDGDRIAFAEQIKLGIGRIRDLVEHPDGTIALLSEGRLILLRPSDLENKPAVAAAAAPPPTLVSALVDTTRGLLKDLAKIRRY